jgi:prevent-host-death family protein
MRSVSALDVRKHFGQLLDEAAAGERLIIERAGQPVAALVPLSDLPESREERIRRQLKAIDNIRRLAGRNPARAGFDAAKVIREQRDERGPHIARVVREWEEKHTEGRPQE